jgi:hypothetical protein
LPENLPQAKWFPIGQELARLQTASQWWLGDWWAFGEHRYGERKAKVGADNWHGPSFQTCMNAASVCRAFPTSRRREVLSFSHHAAVLGFPPEKADELLDWCETEKASLGKLQAEIERRRWVPPVVQVMISGGGTREVVIKPHFTSIRASPVPPPATQTRVPEVPSLPDRLPQLDAVIDDACNEYGEDVVEAYVGRRLAARRHGTA